MKHLIHVRAKPNRKTELAIIADAKRYGGNLGDVTDKGGLFEFPTRGAAELFRDRVNANYSSAHADHITDAN
jgi:hypothetical protein